MSCSSLLPWEDCFEKKGVEKALEQGKDGFVKYYIQQQSELVRTAEALYLDTSPSQSNSFINERPAKKVKSGPRNVALGQAKFAKRLSLLTARKSLSSGIFSKATSSAIIQVGPHRYCIEESKEAPTSFRAKAPTDFEDIFISTGDGICMDSVEIPTIPEHIDKEPRFASIELPEADDSILEIHVSPADPSVTSGSDFDNDMDSVSFDPDLWWSWVEQWDA